MTMSKGSVTIDGTGVATGTGATKFAYDKLLEKYPSIDAMTSTTAKVAAKQQLADLAAVFGELVQYVLDNAQIQVTILTTDQGLQRMPASTAAGTNCSGPLVNKTLTGTIT